MTDPLCKFRDSEYNPPPRRPSWIWVWCVPVLVAATAIFMAMMIPLLLINAFN